MQICISLASYLVLVNGSFKGYFKSRRGLRQGDPLCLSLFILVTKALNKLIFKAVEVELLKGWQIPFNGPNIAIL